MYDFLLVTIIVTLAISATVFEILIRLFVQDRNTSNKAVQYKKYEKREKKLDQRNVREVPKQIFVNMPLGLIKCNINFFKKLLTVFLITKTL